MNKVSIMKNLGAAALVMTAAVAMADAPKSGLIVPADYASNWGEKNAVEYFTNNGTVLLGADADLNEYDVVTVYVDRILNGDLPQISAEDAFAQLPADIAGKAAALKDYVANGGSLFLAKQATLLCEKAGVVPEGYAPRCGNLGAGDAMGGDYWNVMPQLGWRFRPGGVADGQEGYYDRSGHAIYEGLTFAGLNGWIEEADGFVGAPLTGKVNRGDRNCMWDCNQYGKGDEKDVIVNFEKATGSQVLGTWGHVQDHCVAGIVEFLPKSEKAGTVIANGLAAYQFTTEKDPACDNNVEKMTANTVNYLASKAVRENQGTGVAEVEVEEAPVYYTVSGVRVATPAAGLYIKVAGGKATKVVVK